MDQRKLMDNANTITDMAKTQNTVYELVSDMNGRQDVLDERVTTMEDKLTQIQESLDSLPDVLARCLQKHQELLDQRRVAAPSSNSLHPDMAARPGGYPALTGGQSPRGSPVWQQQQQQPQQPQGNAPPIFPRASLSPTLQSGERSPPAPASLSGQSLPKSEA